MDVLFVTDKLTKELNTQKLLFRRHGDQRTKIIGRRLQALRAANTLEDLRNMPGRLHELTGDRAETFALDLDQPYRLIFETANNPIPRKEDGGLEWRSITAVRILEVENYHD
ncbi:MAG: type II toxin-antitoxin system RelE/ParE family toxin [Desulfuromonadales bacterium]|nr:type II toxin-antitoxin system RelE/ParE family toxin [Desulfuromonadales bacterium]